MISIQGCKINPAQVVWISDKTDEGMGIFIQFVGSSQTILYKDVNIRNHDYKNLEAGIDNYLLQKQNATIHEGS